MAFDRPQVLHDCWAGDISSSPHGPLVMQPQGVGAGLSQSGGCWVECKKVPRIRLCLLSGNH